MSQTTRLLLVVLLLSAGSAHAQINRFGVQAGLTSTRIVDFTDDEWNESTAGFSLAGVAEIGKRSGLTVEGGFQQRARISRLRYHGDPSIQTRVSRLNYLYGAALLRLGVPVGGVTAVFQAGQALNLRVLKDPDSIANDLVIGAVVEAGVEIPALLPRPFRIVARVSQDITPTWEIGSLRYHNRVFELRAGVLF